MKNHSLKISSTSYEVKSPLDSNKEIISAKFQPPARSAAPRLCSKLNAENLISPMKTNLSFTIRRLLRIFACSLAILATLFTAQATLIYTDFNIDSGSTNVGTFYIRYGSLFGLSQLSASGSLPFNYAYRVFTPSVTGNYTLGMTTANYDPVMILYSGLTSFPANPATGAMALNDDGNWDLFSGRTPTSEFMPLLLRAV